MMVLFVSECEKKSIKTTNRILDSFADRIGHNTWQTLITDEGLSSVKNLLRKTATKNTAVACHWIRSKHERELAWIVGNRNKFNYDGIVPVNYTKKNISHLEWENDWDYLPQIKVLITIASLLHDWGKSSDLFQDKLAGNGELSDPLRHEWVSCILLSALVKYSGNSNTDDNWMDLLINYNFNEQDIINIAKQEYDINKLNDNYTIFVFRELPYLAKIICWLILSHHKIPVKDSKDFIKVKRDSLNSMLDSIDETWGYKNNHNDNFNKRVANCFNFKNTLLNNSNELKIKLIKWTSELKNNKDKIINIINNEPSVLRQILNYSRLCLVLSDHYISSMPNESRWNNVLLANTNRDGSPKQKLDEHLVRIANQSLKIVRSLPRLMNCMGKAYDIKSISKKSPAQFAWQDKAVEKIKEFRGINNIKKERNNGFFIVNMASTGCGKTIANAKIMQSISEDEESLRYILALGLRTLTLQTGDEYKNKIGLDQNELAVVIGSAAVQKLHEEYNKSNDEINLEDELLDEDVNYSINEFNAEFMDVFFPKNKLEVLNKNKAFLYKPVLVCTIDNIIPATEKIKGGKHILPFLRLMSSDLVIDEIDDFDKIDLIAIGRLIHLAGMFGRSVVISSATIPPGLAEALYNSYQEGFNCYKNFHNKISAKVIGVWCDEFNTQIQDIPSRNDYENIHKKFIDKRCKRIATQIIRRKAGISKIPNIIANATHKNKVMPYILKEQYFDNIKEEIKNLHFNNHTIDNKTNKKVSFGVVRIANITPCVGLARYLINDADWGDDFTPKIIVYHSRQTLLMRHVQEKYLDSVLKRKEEDGEMPQSFNSPEIREHINNSKADNIAFILIATPVEEVGRDHDFDWAVVEPSSFRSIIQLAGRIRRHRKQDKNYPNINMKILQCNYRRLKNGALNEPSFRYPGYEDKNNRFNSNNLDQLVDEKELLNSIDARIRIIKPKKLDPKNRLSDLEHFVMDDLKNINHVGSAYLQGWLTEYCWLSGLHQKQNSFRSSLPDTKLYLIQENMNSDPIICEKSKTGAFVKTGNINNIIIFYDSLLNQDRLWLKRNYIEELKNKIENLNIITINKEMKKLSKKYGEITVPDYLLDKTQYYSDQLGLFRED